jgi:hypothetical protein
MLSRFTSLQNNSKNNKKGNPQEKICPKGKNCQKYAVCFEIKGGRNEVQNLYLKSSTVSDFLSVTAPSWGASLSAVFHRIPLLLLYLPFATCEEGVAGRSKPQSALYRLRAPFTGSGKEITLSPSKVGKVTAVEVLR